MTDPAVETVHHILPLTFQDRSIDFEVGKNITIETAAPAASADSSAVHAAENEALALAAEPATADLVNTASSADAAVVMTSGASSAEGEAALPSEVQELADESATEGVDFTEGTDITDDFEMEPLPEPMVEASPQVAQKLGSLTLPAALCDDELLGELASIPNKMGFKIGEVAEMLGIKQYVLRYWETEFDVLKPKKAANNQRYYTKKDVENVYLIRKLLHRDRFSIEGARSAMKDLKNVVKKEKDWSSVNNKVESLQERVDHFLVDLRKLQRLFT